MLLPYVQKILIVLNERYFSLVFGTISSLVLQHLFFIPKSSRRRSRLRSGRYMIMDDAILGVVPYLCLKTYELGFIPRLPWFFSLRFFSISSLAHRGEKKSFTKSAKHTRPRIHLRTPLKGSRRVTNCCWVSIRIFPLSIFHLTRSIQHDNWVAALVPKSDFEFQVTNVPFYRLTLHHFARNLKTMKELPLIFSGTTIHSEWGKLQISLEKWGKSKPKTWLQFRSDREKRSGQKMMLAKNVAPKLQFALAAMPQATFFEFLFPLPKRFAAATERS